jgi:hypothetical protein
MTPTERYRSGRTGRRQATIHRPPGLSVGQDPAWRRRVACRVLPAGALAVLRAGVRAHGWSGAELGRRADVSARYAGNLLAGERCPSVTVADRLVQALALDEDAAAVLLDAAVPLAGEASPYRRGWSS